MLSRIGESDDFGQYIVKVIMYSRGNTSSLMMVEERNFVRIRILTSV
jgi:hypothetical protein